MSQEGWGPKWTATVGAQVRMLRESAGLGSAQKLADRCVELGFPIPRSTIANMENGQRPNVTVQEVAVLAAALGVPPIRLLYPIRDGSTPVEVLPGVEELPMDAVERFTDEYNGHNPAAGLSDNPSDLDMAREEARLAREWFVWRMNQAQAADNVERLAAGLEAVGQWTSADDLARVVERVERAGAALRAHRKKMRAQGITPAGADDA